MDLLQAPVRFAVLLLALMLASEAFAHTNFETVPVRPLALSLDGRRLFATNTPDGQLEIFDIKPWGLRHRASVPVGLDPVAVAARTESEVWVVNHLSDSVSIVDVGAEPPRVVRTLLVGDEPWDVVFGGKRAHERAPFPRAFVSAARRGQNHPENANGEYREGGQGRADVWVFDAENLGDSLGGTPETIVRVFGDKPRPLAVTPDGSRVYVGVFHSGNQTTSINPGAVCDGGADRGPCRIGETGVDDPPVSGEPGTGTPPVLPGGVLGPNVDADGNPSPEIGLIAKYDRNAKEWQDSAGRNWNGAVPFTLPDLDVFAIDALAQTPVEIESFPHVGTILFNMAVDRRGRLFVANTDANNAVRFEGSGQFGTTVLGDLHRARITVIERDGRVTPRHLNKHIDYSVHLHDEATRERSLATPHELAFSPNGRELYVAAFGSSKIGVIPIRKLLKDTFTPDPADHIALSDGGPTGIVVDKRSKRLYVYTRFGNSISIVDPGRRKELGSVALHNPEPESVRKGRPFLYDARFSSSNGEASCSSCHALGDKDDLAWDLGNPDATTLPNLNPFFVGTPIDFHPLKGPMTTQTLRGMADQGPMHWRGDRSGANAPGATPEDAFDEVANFLAFNGAFESLLGRESQIAEEEMRAFADLVLGVFLPPNPLRDLDNLDRGTHAEGLRVFTEVDTNMQANKSKCENCHRLDPRQGFFGTGGESVPDPKSLKVPHLRNMYDKAGGFGVVALNEPGNDGHKFGDQIRGFGFSHSGSLVDIESFLRLAMFMFPGGAPQRAQMADFLLAFPSNMAPIVGQQVTLRAESGPDTDARIDLLIDQARSFWIVKGNDYPLACDLIVKGVIDGEPRGWFFDPIAAVFRGDRAADSPLLDADLRTLTDEPGRALTYTCTPPGSGPRMGLDRDGDGSYDGDEHANGTDPGAAGSVIGACGDGIDNDGDGSVDYPEDPGCADASGDSEIESAMDFKQLWKVWGRVGKELSAASQGLKGPFQSSQQ